jgi:hypothetical protein
MPPQLPKGTRFVVPRTGKKKYTAVIPQRGGKTRRVSFGHRDYQHYKDQVPKRMGGGRWAKKDHGDKKRRTNYRKRHAGMKCKDGTACIKKRYSPAWFSYYYLW